MSDLSPRARQLIELGRVGDEPDSAARDRVRSKLLMAVGTGVAASAAAKSATAAGKVWAGSALLKLMGGVCAAGIAVGGATWAVSTRAPDSEPPLQARSPAITAQAVRSAERPATSETVASSTPAAPTEVLRAPKVIPPPRASSAAVAVSASAQPGRAAAEASTLEGELSLLREAQAAMARGNAGRSLELLEEHGSRYPNGILSQEREAARVLALCGLGRHDEARAEAARFVEKQPTSPLSARVRSSCAR